MNSNVNNVRENDIQIRRFAPEDLESIYEICLKTGDSGKDASDLYNYPQLLGDFYAAPYVILEPELALVATVNNIPKGYILGTANTEAFAKKCEIEWFPEIRKKYVGSITATSKDESIINLINSGYEVKRELSDYPAHLHIDLLPVLQGKGIGRKLIAEFISILKKKNVSGVHLEVGKKNLGAIQFYKKIGFNILEDYKFSYAFGLKLN